MLGRRWWEWFDADGMSVLNVFRMKVQEVIPDGDAVSHSGGAGCMCGPRLIRVYTDDCDARLYHAPLMVGGFDG